MKNLTNLAVNGGNGCGSVPEITTNSTFLVVI